jgi:alkyl hydroperoxide reductase subunit D
MESLLLQRFLNLAKGRPVGRTFVLPAVFGPPSPLSVSAMSRIAPLPKSAAPDNVVQTYERIEELFDGQLPDVFLPMGQVEPFLKDFYMNFKKFVYTAGALDPLTKAYLGIVASCHAKSDPWIDFYTQRAKQLGATDQQIAEVMAITAINYTYNTFFKFRDLSGSALFEGMAVGLRAHTFTNTSLDDKTVELINIAISDINACKPCTSGHVEKARHLGLSDNQLLECIQCVATAYAGAQFLNFAGSV